MDEKDEIDEHLIENINNLKLLEYLYLKGFKLKNQFILKLFILKYLIINCC